MRAKKSIIFKIRRIWILYAVSLSFATPICAGTPPYHVKDPAIQVDLEELEQKASNHAHDGNGSVRLPRADPAPRTNLTPFFPGEPVYDQTAKVMCYSTGTLNTQWAIITSSSTACPH